MVAQFDACPSFERAHSPDRPELTDPDALYRQGHAFLKASDPYRAVRVFEALASLAPDHPGLPDAMASAYRRDARYRDAIRIIDEALARGLIADQLIYEKALSLSYLGDADAALAAYDRLLEADPDHAAAWFGSHAPALQLGRPDEMLRRLERAVACVGANGKYWGFLAVYHLLLGDQDRAQALFAQRLAGHPKRLALWDSVAAIRSRLCSRFALFGLSAPFLRYALEEAALPGLVLEFGVRRGNSMQVIADAAGQPVHGFDSFEGLPESWGREPRGVLTTGAEVPEVPANATLHVGWFEDTLPPFLDRHGGPVRFVNIDSDIYASARTVLTALQPRIQRGTVIVFDELIGNRTWRDDEYKAFQEFVAATGLRYEYFALGPYTKQVAVRVL